MADNLRKKPKKSILKNSSSFDKPELPLNPRKSLKETTWDEMNIIATLHPADKDYGHMKIDEPKTPYNYVDPDKVDGLDVRKLEEKIKQAANLPPKALLEQDESSDSDDEDLSPEDKAKKKEFEHKRKKHYNEFLAVKLARKLLEEEDEEEDGGEANKSTAPLPSTTTTTMAPAPVPIPKAKAKKPPTAPAATSGQCCSKYMPK